MENGGGLAEIARSEDSGYSDSVYSGSVRSGCREKQE